MKMVVENVVETIASLNNKEETLQDEINDRYVNETNWRHVTETDWRHVTETD